MTRRGGLVLLFGGSDPSGGAGLELDLKVLARLGVHGAAIATCYTLQTAVALVERWNASRATARRQLDLLARDARVGAIKIGMVAGGAWIDEVTRALGRWPELPVIVDPIVAPTRGNGGLSLAAIAHLRRRLLPQTGLLTPNAIEAAALLGTTLPRVARDPGGAARALLDLGPRAVLLKGGHLPATARREHARSGSTATVTDFLRGGFGDVDFVAPRRVGRSPRGTGCALASAIAAQVVSGHEWRDAIHRSIVWLRAARSGAISMGRGRDYLGLEAGAVGESEWRAARKNVRAIMVEPV